MIRPIDDVAIADLFRELTYAYASPFATQFGDLNVTMIRQRWAAALARVVNGIDIDRTVLYLLRTTNRPPNLADVLQAVEATHQRVAL